MDIPKIKKEICLFLNSEEAKVLKKDIAKLGLAASVIAGIIAQAQNSQAQAHTDHADHSDHNSGAVHTDSFGPHNSHDSHVDSHSDGHSDSHSSSAPHTDSAPHNDSSTHVDCHSNATGAHSSQAIYNAAEKKGGHNSNLVHSNYCI